MDFATILSPALTFDWAIAGGDLQDDDGLFTAVAISLFSDRLANPDDEIPDGTSDRRGWGLDWALPPLADGSADHIGSRLWLLARALAIPETAQKAQAYCQEALQWLVDDGVAATVTVPLPTFPHPWEMKIRVIVAQMEQGQPVDKQFDFLWDMTRNTASLSGIVIGGV